MKHQPSNAFDNIILAYNNTWSSFHIILYRKQSLIKINNKIKFLITIVRRKGKKEERRLPFMEGKYERMLNKRIANKETEDKKSVSTYANVGRYINEKKKKKEKKKDMSVAHG